MDIIVDHKRTKVFYDNKRKLYVKKFYPRLEMRLKYALGLRRYPGTNFHYISDTLNSLGIKTPEIERVGKYEVVTKKISGEPLSEHLLRDRSLVKEFLDLIVKVLENGIYFGDFNTNNFIVNEGSIYALDLEDYRKELFFNRTTDEALRRLRTTLYNDAAIKKFGTNPNFDIWVDYVEKKLKKPEISETYLLKELQHSFT
ncbi:hypothetical protein PM10SUCC1_06730 [Propionigenium maris DSM 9537]|uniref:Uncharacterized protein n=1 Tax=Propionigenium maris DSM 9537 TaxID=1123000 RepID=A0A9W6LM74_9FUSO|nr:Mn2+dependent serine/threonine protein kinase [Propionigenium maris]GLI55158.1 hypothetical protein PM10SUCC1_06730 [Propionigenium maris DSM 9537]